MTPPEHLEASEAELARLEETGRIGPYEKEYVLADGSRRWVLFAGRRIEPNLIAEYAIDISDRKRAEAERELLAHELSHRVKNTLAVVQALARRTGGNTVEEFREIFAGRLNALAQAHSMLLADNWRSADLAELVRRTLLPYATDGGRLAIEGDAVPISARQALSLSLVLHELGTNAVKYGALSVEGGRVQVSWQVARQDGGRPAAAALARARRAAGDGARTGTASARQLIQRTAEFELSGTFQADWAREGLTVDLEFPLE